GSRHRGRTGVGVRGRRQDLAARLALPHRHRSNWDDGYMIPRYTLPEMGRVWSEEHKYELWCRIETMVLEAHAAAGVVPQSAVAPVRAAPPPTPEAVDTIEQV